MKKQLLLISIMTFIISSSCAAEFQVPSSRLGNLFAQAGDHITTVGVQAKDTALNRWQDVRVSAADHWVKMRDGAVDQWAKNRENASFAWTKTKEYTSRATQFVKNDAPEWMGAHKLETGAVFLGTVLAGFVTYRFFDWLFSDDEE